MEFAYASFTGLGKESNDDTVLVDGERNLYAVADGVGALIEASQASRLAIETIQNAARSAPHDFSVDVLFEWVQLANRALFDTGQTAVRPLLSTATLAHVDGGSVNIAHCGDSRAYLFCDGRLSQLTTDHTVVEELHRRGHLPADQTFDHPRRNVLRNCLGQHERARVDIRSVMLRERASYLLLCTDGISAFLTNDEAGECLAAIKSPSEGLDRLVRAARAGGSHDDMTAVLVRCC